jgi:hypothetical protein
MRNVLLVFLYGEKNNPGKKPVSGFFYYKISAARQKTHNRTIMARQEEDRPRTLTMTTRSDTRANALRQLHSEWCRYFHVIDYEHNSNPMNKRLRRKQHIMLWLGSLCSENAEDHLFIHTYEDDSSVIACVNAICDGEDNAFSTEYPFLSKYIRNTYNRVIVRADIRVSTLPYLHRDFRQRWNYDEPRLFINGSRVGTRMVNRVRCGDLLEKARVVTTRLKYGRFKDSKRALFSALHMTLKHTK